MDTSWSVIGPLEQIMLDEYTPYKPDIITICISLDENVRTKWLHSSFIPRLLAHPRFSSKVVERKRGRYVFESIPGFTGNSTEVIENHVSIEAPIDSRDPEKEQIRLFASRLSEISSLPLDRDRPLWKVFLFPAWSIAQPSEKSRQDTSTLVLRVHHSVADGIGLVKYFLAAVADKEEDFDLRTLLVPPERQIRTQESRKGVRGNNERNILRQIGEAFEAVHTVSLKPLIHDPPCTFTRANVQESNLCALLPSTRLAVDTVKEASKRLGITINDLLFAAVSGAIRSYLIEHGDDPNSLKGLRVAIPFNKHMFDKFDMSDVSNQLAMIPVQLHIHKEDRTQRVAACAKAMARLKRGHQPSLVLIAFKMLSSLPKKSRKKVWAHFAAATSALLSNVAGPKEKAKIGGVDVTAVHFLPPCDVHTGANIGIFSYDGKFGIAVSGDANRLAHPQKLLDLLHAEVLSIVAMSKDGNVK